MEKIETRCQVIKSDGTIQQIIVLIEESDKEGAKSTNSFQSIVDNFKKKYDCLFYHLNIASANYPGDTCYTIFYESNTHMSGKPFNEMGTKTIYNSKIKCYGDCYIIHFDDLFNFYDVDQHTFINACNTRISSFTKTQKIPTQKSHHQTSYSKNYRKSRSTNIIFNSFMRSIKSLSRRN